MKGATQVADIFGVDEYIRLDEVGQIRHEYYNGKLFPMPGETLLHNEICLRLSSLLRHALLSKGWKVYMESVKVKIENEEIYLYPDIMVMKEDTEVQKHKDYVVYKPAFIAEILSDSTRKYDYTDKFIQYQKISSLHYYLLVEPERQVVLFYEKDLNGDWTAKTYTELLEVIMLPLLGTDISLENIYRDNLEK